MENKPQAKQRTQLAAWKQAVVKAEAKFLAIEDNQEVAKRELGFAIQALEANPYLQGCTPASITNAVINIARTSITLNPILKLCYLVPRKVKGQLTAILDFSYMGLVKMLKDSGSIKFIDAIIVYEDEVDADNYQFDVSENKVKHIQIHVKTAEEQKKRKVYGVYSRVIFPDNTILFTQLMPNWEIEKIRDTSESYKNVKSRAYSPWVTWEEEMIKKTKLKRDFKMLIAENTSPQLAAALEIERENNEANFGNNKPNRGKGMFSTFADTEDDFAEAEIVKETTQKPKPKKEAEKVDAIEEAKKNAENQKETTQPNLGFDEIKTNNKTTKK